MTRALMYSPRSMHGRTARRAWRELRTATPRVSRREGDCVPVEQFILFVDNLHGHTTDEFKKFLLEQCDTLLWLLPADCTDEVRPIDAGYGCLLKVHVGKAFKQLSRTEKKCGKAGAQQAVCV